MTNPLARAIMGNNIRETNKENLESKTTHNNYKKDGVDADLTRLINDLIQGEKKVVEESSVNEKITLEEAANRVKKGL